MLLRPAGLTCSYQRCIFSEKFLDSAWTLYNGIIFFKSCDSSLTQFYANNSLSLEAHLHVLMKEGYHG